MSYYHVMLLYAYVHEHTYIQAHLHDNNSMRERKHVTMHTNYIYMAYYCMCGEEEHVIMHTREE
jgi:hypothetical protein